MPGVDAYVKARRVRALRRGVRQHVEAAVTAEQLARWRWAATVRGVSMSRWLSEIGDAAADVVLEDHDSLPYDLRDEDSLDW